MSYKFSFDLTKLPFELFKESEKFSQMANIIENINEIAIDLVKKYNVDKITGLPFSDSITLVEDIIDVQIKNQILKKYFLKSKKRAVFLPHCCRKHMDSNCKAEFNSETSSYICKHCSKNCMVSQATKFAKRKNYDVYILPGSSCVEKILQTNAYDGIIGVACTNELKLATRCLMEFKIATQCIPLTKNGCSGTKFNLETLKKIIIES